jgi:hypothetical protein
MRPEKGASTHLGDICWPLYSYFSIEVQVCVWPFQGNLDTQRYPSWIVQWRGQLDPCLPQGLTHPNLICTPYHFLLHSFCCARRWKEPRGMRNASRFGQAPGLEKTYQPMYPWPPSILKISQERNTVGVASLYPPWRADLESFCTPNKLSPWSGYDQKLRIVKWSSGIQVP